MESVPAVAGWNPTRHKDTIRSVGYRLGIWSNEEVDLLKNNVEEYCRDNDIKEPAEIIFHCRKEERKDFYKKASLGINRPVQAVYRRLLRMYDKTNNLGKYSEEEVEKLKRLKEAHGKNWQVISKKLGRSASSVKDKCRNLETIISGKWTEEEEKTLSAAVHILTNTLPGTNVCEGIDWQEVAKSVKTRNELQCRAKWLMHLNWKNFGGRDWTHLDDKRLVGRLAELNPDNENKIDWAALASGWDAARSAQWLRSKWRMLKYEYRTGKFPKIRDFCIHLINNSEFLKKRTTKLLDDLTLGNIETILLTTESDFDNIITISSDDPITISLLPENSEITLLRSDDDSMQSNSCYLTQSDECDSGSYIEYVTLDEPAVEVIIDCESDERGNMDSNDGNSRLSGMYPYPAEYGNDVKRFNQMVKNDVPLSEMVTLDDERDVVEFNSPLHCLASAAVDHEILLDDESIFGQCLMNNEDHV